MKTIMTAMTCVTAIRDSAHRGRSSAFNPALTLKPAPLLHLITF
ncbi:MAG: hypothetical protein Q8937_18830 [Bacteroidota bacterium]|nr:hypothetical protein [Bacteroidota bacterium]